MNAKLKTPSPEKVYDLETEPAPSRPPTVLLLEDDGSLAVPLMERLQEDGFRVSLVTNGADGLRELMTTDFDVIICDMLMPHLPGDMFYLAVERTKPALCKRFVFMTGHKADPKWDAFVRKVGGVMLWKPFQYYELRERIDLVIRKGASAPADARPARHEARPMTRP
jgi:DNA-binding response OmpR family regulator